ncbi:MAG: DUF370 domain-containing protein [Lachnospiraceae bacterium]|nr:DUF370 domain-containing protein [Lachnospiraceae bacterium]
MFVNIGFGNYINSAQVVSVSRADSAPMKRLIGSAREQGILVDVTQGRKTKSVITAMNGQVILSALMPETITDRCRADHSEKIQEKPEETEDE